MDILKNLFFQFPLSSMKMHTGPDVQVAEFPRKEHGNEVREGPEKPILFALVCGNTQAAEGERRDTGNREKNIGDLMKSR